MYMETDDLVSIVYAHGLAFRSARELETQLQEYGWEINIPPWQWAELTTPEPVEEECAPYPQEPYEMQDYADDTRLLGIAHYALGANKPEPKEQPTVTINDVTYINGMDVTIMSVEHFLDAIKRIDDEIKRLEDLNVESATVQKSIDKMKLDRARIVTLLDKQHAGDSE